MKSSHEKDVREKVMFLKRTAPFQEMSDGAIKKFAFESKWVKFNIGEVICVQGQPLNDLFFVRKGECKILADYELNGVQGKLKIGRYSQYEYFGQEASMEPGAMARFTVVADYTMTASDKKRNLRATEIKEKFSVECLQFRCSDMKDMRTFLQVGMKYSKISGKLSHLSAEEIKEKKCDETTQLKWQATRRRMVNEFTRARTGDPSLTFQVVYFGVISVGLEDSK
jgi:hypothetical protein